MIEPLQQFIVSNLAGIGVGGGVGLALFLGAKFGPRLLQARLKALFLGARSGWLLDQEKPKRLKAYLAVLELFEDEIPESNDPSADGIFLRLGTYISSHLPPLISGTPSSWAKLIRSLSDETDAAMDAEIAEIKKLLNPPL